MGNGNRLGKYAFLRRNDSFCLYLVGPTLEANGKDLVILGFDQNRAELEEWVDVMYKDESEAQNILMGLLFIGMKVPMTIFQKHIMRTIKRQINSLFKQKLVIDSEVPVWQNDSWYWEKHATDWGFDWREESKKYLHPKYAPANRYARDIIGCRNNWVDGWIDWNTGAGP